jgi:phosphoserine phosphatase
VPNIAIIWDFDGTLTPDDSTTETVQTIAPDIQGEEFWKTIKKLRGDDQTSENWKEHILAMDAPIWMFSLSRLAFARGVPLNTEFFKTFVLPRIRLFPHVESFLSEIKDLENKEDFSNVDLKIHHFIVSAGLKELIQLVFDPNLVRFTYGCRFTVAVANDDYKNEPESIPVYCMDETAKTRAIFEISKGAFCEENISVNQPVRDEWAKFSDMIYIGDGDTDIPALSLVRQKGGTGIVVFNPDKPKDEIEKKLINIRKGERADLIVPADFSNEAPLYTYIKQKCIQICKKYEAYKVPK